MGGGRREGQVNWAGSPRRPRTHAGSSPEGDTTFDEEHPHVAAADSQQHAAEAQVDEADEDLDRLRGAGGGSAGLHAAPCRPRRTACRAPCSPSQLPATETCTPRFCSFGEITL